MAQQLYFSRDSIMLLEIGATTWKIPVLEGFSFSQATNVSEVTLNEMESTAGVSRRGRRAFNDSLSPVEFSFGTYIRPFKSEGTSFGTGKADANTYHHAVEEALWALFSGPGQYSTSAYRFMESYGSPSVDYHQSTHDATNLDMDFSQSNKSALGTPNGSSDSNANLYFTIGDANKITYKLGKIALNEASIDFDIDGVASINWSGFADTITQFSRATAVNDADVSNDAEFTLDSNEGIVAGQTVTDVADTLTTGAYVVSVGTSNKVTLNAAQTLADDIVLTFGPPVTDITEGTGRTDNFIRNRLTTLEIDPVDRDPGDTGSDVLEDDYTLTLTGGNITLANNISYLTPEELGVVNVPIGHVTGTRSFSGSFTCYLSDDTLNTTSSKDFFDDVTSIREVVSNSFKLVFSIGGGTEASAVTPSLQLTCAKAHVDIPTHSIEDIITLETTFNALPTSIDSTDEVTLKYYGPTAA